MSNLKLSSAFLLSSALGVVLSGPSLAADSQSKDEIIVTATKMGETKLQETPLAITAVGGDQIERTGVKDLRDLAALTPNLTVGQNADFAQVFIRGIGSNNVFAGADPSSTMQIDGIYIARPAAQITTFMDVERVEILRGPQGTLYGRNSVGGTVNIISRKPDNEFHAKAQATFGNYGLWRADGYVSGPLIEDKLSASLSLMRSKHDGYRKNIVASGNDVESDDSWITRGQIRATPNDRLEILLRADYLDIQGAPMDLVKLLTPLEPVTDSVLGDYKKVALDFPHARKSWQWGVSSEINYELADNVKVSSLTAYRKNKTDLSVDADGSALPILQSDLIERQDQFSEEINISGSFDRLSYVAGVYYFSEDIFTDAAINVIGDGISVGITPAVNTQAWAAYAQANLALTDQLSLTAGIRYTDETKDFAQNFLISLLSDGSPVVGPVIYDLEGNYKAWTPKFGIEYSATDNLLLYASATRGFKSGGFNFSTASPVNGYEPEYLWSYEVGFKSDLLGKRLRVNGNAFYYDYTNLQVQAFIVPGTVDVTNAATAKVKGAELEFLATPADGLEFGGSLAYLDATYKTYNPAFGVGGVEFDASGNDLNWSPNWSYGTFAQYTANVGENGEAFLRAEYSWKDRHYFSPENSLIQSQESFGLLNASIGYALPGKNLQVVLFGRNLLDKEYLTGTASIVGIAGYPGAPRTYGVRVTAQY